MCKREREREREKRERERERKRKKDIEKERRERRKERVRIRERERERENAMFSYKQIMPRGAHVAATVAPLVFVTCERRCKNSDTKKLFPFWFYIVKANITN